MTCEPTVERIITDWTATGEVVQGKRAGRSGSGWTSQEGVAIVRVTTTTYEPEVGEDGECIKAKANEEVLEGVPTVQYVNPGGQITYDGPEDEGEDEGGGPPEGRGRPADAGPPPGRGRPPGRK